MYIGNIVWLDKNQIAERLGIHIKTAETLMHEMHPVPISGKVRKRWRVSEQNFEEWMNKQGDGQSVHVSKAFGTNKKLARR